MRIEDLIPIIDALVFASETPLSVQRIKQILDEEASDPVSLKDIKEALDYLSRDNRDQQRGFFLQEVAGGYQYRTRPAYAPWIRRLRKTKPFRLTQSTLETLAIIAYKQPIIRAEIEKIRGVDSGGVLKNLLERGLIKITARKNIPGRPFMFATTNKFLEVFGLEKLADLPPLKDFETFNEGQLPTMLREHAGEEVCIEDDSATEQTISDTVSDADLATIAHDRGLSDTDPLDDILPIHHEQPPTSENTDTN
ncbi:MAG: SMC-Scp complex subunit ScpB [Desulfobacterota bacterium]|nr:SMC-Scp complex subunit ScpB [Thermodesulfobacteriota bacterium]